MVNVLVVSRAIHVNEAVESGLGDPDTVTVYDGLDRKELCRALASARVVVTSGMGLPRKFLDGEALDCAPDLKLIQQFGVGKEVMDVAAAHERGIWVATLPQANSVAVAEIGLFLIFCLGKELKLNQKAVQRGAFATPLCGEICGKRFCVVGLGNIGSALAVRLRALGGHVVAVDRSSRAGAAKSVGVSELYPPGDLLLAVRDADYVVLCVPFTEATRNLIGEAELRAMGPSARLINIARGEIVHRESLEKAIFSGGLAGYATDVGWEEPIDPAEPLWQRDDVVVSPHIGGTTRETIELNLQLVRENIRRVEKGVVPLFVVPNEGDEASEIESEGQ